MLSRRDCRRASLNTPPGTTLECALGYVPGIRKAEGSAPRRYSRVAKPTFATRRRLGYSITRGESTQGFGQRTRPGTLLKYETRGQVLGSP
jgi:hypothetical protein